MIALILLTVTFLFALIGFVRYSLYFIFIVLTGSAPQFNPAYHLMSGHTGKALLFFIVLGVPGYVIFFGSELIILSIFGYSILAEILSIIFLSFLSLVLMTGYAVLFRNVYRLEEEKEPELEV
ncbi:hypothetical protein [Alkalicoccus luteus]|uniref:Uncharacterized protein n=1 Tax=Alkalicoccus luteus TaxID=1237094 RepID=A0A969PRV1_9BACI|nr:hypothetical protein [Alkalicoccus luteus]NJP39266.1 hypothetical protein [Alkalicoccus luteus]